MAKRTGSRVTVILLEGNPAEGLREVRSNMFKSTADELGLTPISPFVWTDKEEGKYKIVRGAKSNAFTLVPAEGATFTEYKTVDVPTPSWCGLIKFIQIAKAINDNLKEGEEDVISSIITPDGRSYGLYDLVLSSETEETTPTGEPFDDVISDDTSEETSTPT